MGQSIYLGKGLAFPLRIDAATGDFARAEDEVNVENCVRQLIMTAVGERMIADYGTVVPELTFEDESVAADLVGQSVQKAIDKYEPRVVVTRVGVMTFTVDKQGGTALAVRLSYTIRATNRRTNLVVPFVLKGETP